MVVKVVASNSRSSPLAQSFTETFWAASWENPCFAYVKTTTQISFVVTVNLISAFVFATWIVQYLYYTIPIIMQNFEPLAIYSGCTACFVSNLVRISHVAAVAAHFFSSDDDGPVNVPYEPWSEKTKNVESDQVWHKPGCTATGDG